MAPLVDRMQTAICHVDSARRDLASPLPHNISLAKPLNKQKLCKKYLESQCSDQWRKHLELILSNLPGRVRAYIHWHLHNKHKHSIYKPAPYLTHQCCSYQLELLRICAQHTIHIIPSHLHYAFRHAQADCKDRVCPHCLAAGITVLADKLHIICHYPATNLVLAQFTAKFQELTRLLDFPPFASFTPDEMTRLATPPHQSSPKDGLQKSPPSVASLHMPSVCQSHPFTLLMWICPLMIMLPSHLIAMMISHLSYFHLVSSQRPHHHMATCLYPFTLQDNRCWGSTYSSNGPHMDGVLAKYLRGTATPNAQCVSR